MTGFDPQSNVVYAPSRRSGNGMAVAALVLGLVGLVFFCIPYIAVLCAVLAIVFGFIGRSRAKRGAGGGGMATAGLILGCVSIGLALLLIVGALAFVGLAGPQMASVVQQAAQQAQQQPTTAP